MKKLLLLLLAVVAGAMTAMADGYTELLTNGTCDGTFTGWEKSNGGSGWNFDTDEDGKKAFSSSYEVCKLWQTVTLSDFGINASDIDSGNLECVAAAQVKSGWQKNGNGARVNKVIVYMLNESDTEIGSQTLVNNVLTYYEGWQDFLISFNLTAGTRKLKYYIEARDAINWGGQYGPCYRNLSLKVGTPAPLEEPIPLLYIQSNGVQAFNTGYIHKANTKVVMDCEVTQNSDRGWEALFGGRLGSHQNNAFCFFSRTDGQDIPCFNRSGNEPRGSGFVYGERITIVAYDKTATWYRASDLETAVGSVTTTGTADDGKTPMFLFDLNTSSTEGGLQEDNSKSKMKLYGFKIYEDANLIHDFEPAQRNGIAGLRDKVTGSFAGSMNGALFIAGNFLDETSYPIAISSGDGGQVVTSVNEAKQADVVDVTVTSNEGYVFKSIDVKNADGNLVACNLKSMTETQRIYSFSMPASSVTVTVAFELRPTEEPDPLPYIRSNGQQAFNTNYIHKANTKVVMDCEVKQNADRDWEALFGGRLGNKDNNAFCFFSRTDKQNIPCFNRSGDEPRGSGFVYGERITLVAYDKTATWYRASAPETVAGRVTTSGTADDGKTPMFLFDLNTSSTEGGLQEDNSKSNMKLYGFKIYENENLLHDFVPAQKDGVVGLYDKVTCSFAGSMTDTPFIAGSDTDDPAYPINLVYGDEGQVETNVNEARESTPVEVSIYPNEGYLFQSIDIQDANGNDVSTTLSGKSGINRSYSFYMPASSVTVTVTFKVDDSPARITSVPDNCEFKEFIRQSYSVYSNWGLNFSKTDGSLTLAFEPTGNKVYIQNPFWAIGELAYWVEGTYNKTSGIISVPTKQCVYWNEENEYGLLLNWGSTSVAENGTDGNGNPSYILNFEVDESVTSVQFKLDGDDLYLLNAVSNTNAEFPWYYESTGIMAIWTDDGTFNCNEFPGLDSSGKNAPFASFVPNEPLVPADPTVDEWYDCRNESGFSKLYFTLPTKSVGGMALNPEKLSYSVYVNNGNGPELFTFLASVYSYDLTEDVTEVPYEVYNSDNKYDFHENYCYFYRTNAEGYEPLFTKNIGLRVYYTAGRVRQGSNIVWLYAEEDPDGISEIGSQTAGNGQPTIYNLAGQRMNKMQKGINIVDGKKVLK